VAEYENSLKDDTAHKTFNRLIVLKQQVNEWDVAKRRMALQIMSCVPGVGEEIALTLADHFPSMATLVNTLQSGASEKVATLRLRNDKRTVGPSAVRAIVKALGVE
jgi:hypothetical protein